MFRRVSFLLLLAPFGFAALNAATLEVAQMWSVEPPACNEAIQNRPEPVTSFQTTDVAAHLWFVLRGVAVGDVVSTQYYSPAGVFYEEASGPWPPNQQAGDYCYTDVPFAIAGTVVAQVPGEWTAKILVNGMVLGQVKFTIVESTGGGPRPVVAQGAVVSAADYTLAVAPGAMMSIFGTELAAATTLATDIPLPFELDGVKVEVMDQGTSHWAALFFIAAGQINAQMPFGVTGAVVQVRVWRGENASAPVAVTVAREAPRLFTRDASGSGEAILLHAADWALVSESNPAVPGEYVILYLTGLGGVTGDARTGWAGGDNGGNGPVNHCTGNVTATVGGRNATVVFAGLAPGFVGLYQVNLQIPSGVATGQQTIAVQVGGAVSQGNVHLFVGKQVSSPEKVVEAAIEAQFQGDIDGMFNHYAMDLFPAENQQAGRQLLEGIAAGTTVSDFQFTHLATGMGNRGEMAIVRGIVDYHVKTHNAESPMKHGLLAVMKKVQDEWKVVEIGEDEFLNTEIYLDAGGKNAIAKHGLSGIHLKELNWAINRALKEGSMDEEKLALGTGFSLVGMIPGVGDTVANIWQVFDTFSNAHEAYQEWSNYGTNGLLTLKIKQVGLGGFQIASELVPGLDTIADMQALALEQLIHNLERARALNEFRWMIMNQIFVATNINPRIFLYKLQTYSGKWGLQWVGMTQDDTHFAERPVGAIYLGSNRTLDQRLAFQVAGEVTTDSGSELAEIFRLLRGVERNGKWYLQVDVTHLVREFHVTGVEVLDDYKDIKGKLIAPRVTCRRGKQRLAVELRSGEMSNEVLIDNQVMNQIWRLEIDGLDKDEVEVGVGDAVDGLRVVGKPASGGAAHQIVDLTHREECLDMSIADPSIALMSRGASVSITGQESGETEWKLRLPGDGDSNVDPVERSIPVKVGASGALWENKRSFRFYNDEWNATVQVRIAARGGFHNCVEQFAQMPSGPLWRYVCDPPPADDQYTVSVEVSGVAPVNPNLVIEGSSVHTYGIVNSGDLVEGTTFSRTINVPKDGRGEFDFALVAKVLDDEGNHQYWQASATVFSFFVMKR